MKRLTLLILWILAFATATAHQPATMRNGYDYFPLRGAVKHMRHYSSAFFESEGARIYDTIRGGYTMSLYNFDRKGNVMQESYFRAPRDKKSKSVRKECDVYYVYDERGNCTERRTIYQIDSARDSHIVYYAYDKRGHLAESYDLRADGRKIRYNRYKHNRKGQKVKHQYCSSAPASRKDMESNPQMRYKYNADGQCVREVRYNLSGQIREVVKMSYDAQGNLVKRSSIPKVRPNRDGVIIISTGESYSHIVKLYRYDQRGNCINIRTFIDGEEYKDEMVVEREYDEWDNCTKYRNYLLEGDTTRRGDEAYYQYEYDEQGNWIKRIELKESDGKLTPRWITVREISYYE